MRMINKIAGCRDLHNATGGSMALFVAFSDWKNFFAVNCAGVLKKKNWEKKSRIGKNKSCVPSLRRLRLIYAAENLNKNRRKLLGEYVFETLQL